MPNFIPPPAVFAVQRAGGDRWLVRSPISVEPCLPACLVATLDEPCLDAVRMLQQIGLIPMAVDYRELLKAAIRGTIYEYDIPSPPAAIDANGEAIPPDREALEAFWGLVREVLAEEGVTRPSVLREIANREREDFSDE